MKRYTWPVTIILAVLLLVAGGIVAALLLRTPPVHAVPVAAPSVTKTVPKATVKPTVKATPKPLVKHTAAAPVAAPVTTPAGEPILLIACDGNGSVEPSSFTLACGDGNGGLSSLSWSSWTATNANGSGQYFVNDCTPRTARRAPSSTSRYRLRYPVRSLPRRRTSPIWRSRALV